MLKRVALIFLLLAVLAGAGGSVYYWWGIQAANPDGSEKLVYLPQGQGIWAIAVILEKEGIIRSAPVFYGAYRFHMLRTGRGSQIAGSYFDLSPADSVPEIIQTCLQEPAVRWLTFPEGFTLEQMAGRIAESDLRISQQAFKEAATVQTARAAVDFPLKTDSLEGYLFPDTYQFTVGVNAEDVVRLMCETFASKFYEVNAEQIEASKLSLHELVTVASMIEWEAQINSDRALISSVIRNRLSRGMRLQIDATVQYALGGHRERLVYSDLEVDSPYNTYKYRGLPPGPICNPGLASLKAAINPADTSYLYYVAKPDGSHVFTETHDAHLQAVERVRP